MSTGSAKLYMRVLKVYSDRLERDNISNLRSKTGIFLCMCMREREKEGKILCVRESVIEIEEEEKKKKRKRSRRIIKIQNTRGWRRK